MPHAVRSALATLAICLAAAVGCSTEQADADMSQTQRRALIAELEEMMRLDQIHRSKVTWGTTDEAEIARLRSLPDDENIAERQRRRAAGIRLPKDQADELMRQQTVIDRQNFARLVEITREHGYPSEPVLGPDAPNVTAVLIHAQLDDFERDRGVFHEEVIAGRMEPKTYALMVDRALQHDGRVQLYGTSQPFDPETRTILPPVIESIERTNGAREEIGLPPLEDYTLSGER